MRQACSSQHIRKGMSSIHGPSAGLRRSFLESGEDEEPEEDDEPEDDDDEEELERERRSSSRLLRLPLLSSTLHASHDRQHGKTTPHQ